MPRNSENLKNWRKLDYEAKRLAVLADRKVKYWENPEKFLSANRARKRKSTNGDPPHQGECPLCHITKMLYFDHDHVTNKFRGWICQDCNIGIGHFKDNPEALRAAAFYLIWNRDMKEPF